MSAVPCAMNTRPPALADLGEIVEPVLHERVRRKPGVVELRHGWQGGEGEEQHERDARDAWPVQPPARRRVIHPEAQSDFPES